MDLAIKLPLRDSRPWESRELGSPTISKLYILISIPFPLPPTPELKRRPVPPHRSSRSRACFTYLHGMLHTDFLLEMS